MPYSIDSEKVFGTFFEIQRNLGKTIDIRFKRDDRHVRGKLSDKVGDFHLKWPKVYITVQDAVVSYSGEEEKYHALRIILNPIIGDFKYEFLDKNKQQLQP